MRSFSRCFKYSAVVLAIALMLSGERPGFNESCSTFMLQTGGVLLVGHNLDEGFEVPGFIVVNRRGIEKQNVSWNDLRIEGKSDVPRIRWASKHGSLTYNTLGREFIDGGLNEAGLYVGEMTLLSSKYPSDEKLPKLYHHQWMQYLLDNFESVPQVLDSLNTVMLDGHCQWHFFAADREGRSAVIEFLGGRAVVRTEDGMPVKVLGNLPYDEEMKALAEYEGFGGSKKVDFADREKGRRFVWGETMIRAFAGRPAEEAVPHAFSILKQLDKGATKWSLVYDLKAMRVYWRTNLAPDIRFADFSAFDFSCGAQPVALDIHHGIPGDASVRFKPLADEENSKAVQEALAPWNMGPLSGTLKPRMTDRLSAAAASFRCKEKIK